MGSTQRRHSTGRKAGSVLARKGKRKKSDQKRQPPKLDLDPILGRFSDALAIIATAIRSLVAYQKEGRLEALDLSEELHTLEHGLGGLRRVYNELDVAIGESR